MKYKVHTIIICSLFILAITLTGCKKDGCNAGSGGVTLHVMPQHHSLPITSSLNYRDTAYIKYDAADFPGPNPSDFDVVVAGNANENFIDVPNLDCGQYYIMVTGFDTSAVWNIRVIGGLPLNFSETSGIKDVVVPVNE